LKVFGIGTRGVGGQHGKEIAISANAFIARETTLPSKELLKCTSWNKVEWQKWLTKIQNPSMTVRQGKAPKGIASTGKGGEKTKHIEENQKFKRGLESGGRKCVKGTL